MSYVLWTLVSLVAYAAGLLLMVRVTPKLLTRSFDEGLFMGFASLEILGALLAFGGVVITLLIFNGAIGVKILDFLLLLGIIVLTGRMALFSFRSATPGTNRITHLLVGTYCLLLVLGAAFYIIQLFAF